MRPRFTFFPLRSRLFFSMFCFSLTASALLANPAHAEPLPMLPGEYELTLAISIRGEAAKPDKYTRCVKETQLENPEEIFNTRFFAGFKADPTCKAGDMTLKAGKVSYAAECQKQTVNVEGRVAAKNFSVRRVAKAKTANGLGADSRIDGKWLGECK